MYKFNDFDYLTDGEIDLVLEKKLGADAAKGYVQAYIYKICLHDLKEKIGIIDIRIGYNDNTKYVGHIGYEIDEKYRGNNFAAKACRVIKEVALGYKMDRVIITCNPENIPSRKTCEKIGAKFIEILDLPPNNETYLRGEKKKCVYEWTLNN
jgi:predicted acetyltransferase